MATKEDEKKETSEEESASEDEAVAEAVTRDEEEAPSSSKELARAEGDAGVAPSQLGYRRFVYAAYFAGAIAVAFLASKLIGFAWAKLATWKGIGEPKDEIIYPIAGVLGAGIALYYWLRTRARQLAEEVASELSKVTWPSRREVTNGTTVVIITTVVATVFFALMDRFWGFVTDKVYGM
jgi:preprotein translocase subunit SecE